MSIEMTNVRKATVEDLMKFLNIEEVYIGSSNEILGVRHLDGSLDTLVINSTKDSISVGTPDEIKDISEFEEILK